MKLTPKRIKRTLSKSIDELSMQPELCAKNAGKDFSRNRKLPFKKVVYAILSMAGKSLSNELMECFGLNSNIPTVSAFVQQRNKINCNAFETLFNNFNSLCNEQKLFKGYRLLAIDGSDLHTPTNKNEQDSYYAGTNGQKPYNLLHLNAMYDLMSNIYVDALIQGSLSANEYKAFCSMVDRDNSIYPTIYIADRGYESYNNLAHVQEKGQYFLIRIKDSMKNGIASAINLPTNGEFDISIDLNLTRKQTNNAKADKSLKYLPHNVNFDYLPLHCKYGAPLKPYTIHCRFVRVEITDNTYELLLTNLNPEGFSSSDLKQLYSMRWGIETSFRSLKYSLGLLFFHSKKTEYIIQEIFAKLIMYNFAELIISHIVIKQKKRKLNYKVNFSTSIHVCRNFLLKNISPLDVEALISSHVLPIRLGGSNIRDLSRSKKATSFLYRVS